MWNVWLGLNLITGAGGRTAVTTHAVQEGKRPARRNTFREQAEREDREMQQLARELIAMV